MAVAANATPEALSGVARLASDVWKLVHTPLRGSDLQLAISTLRDQHFAKLTTGVQGLNFSFPRRTSEQLIFINRGCSSS